MILRHPDDPVRVGRLAEAALAAGQRGERLTRQLLAFSRNQELKLETADLPALISQIEPLVRRAVGEAITLVLRVDEATGACQVDSAQFEAALLNLVVNAVDATPAGGEIVIETRAVTLKAGEVGEATAGGYVRVTVTDTGQGMPRDVLERVFEPFFTTKEVGKGTGLGLAQVYGFVRQCGGAVSIDSVEGQGTAVALYLPAAAGVPIARRGDVPASGGFQAPAVGPTIGARVLLVEDDEAVRAMTEGLLIDFGCDLTTAEDGRAALDLFEAGGQFDLLISDIVMPGGLTGVDLAKAVSPDRPDMAILLTTGYAGERIAGAAADLPWAVLRKPFRVEQLAEAVTLALGARV
jgi:CheY-like chemotaxis protein